MVGISTSLESGLRLWEDKCQEYLYSYFRGDRENTRKTTFWDCISKVQTLNDALEEIENINNFRGVEDSQGLLQAAAIIQIQPIDISGQMLTGLAIESLTNAPWNVIEPDQPETRKGSATSLIEELVKESRNRGFSGIVKAITIPRAKPFYRKIGFVETNGSGEMVLTPEAAAVFLIDQQLRRQSQPFD